MKTWIALIRGINVGGRNKVSMKELTALMESNGFSNVRTYIQSGNVVFDKSIQSGDEISDLIEKGFGFRPAVFILSAEDLKMAAKNNPYDPDQGKAVHFYFCDKVPDKVDYELLETLRTGSEEFKLVDNVFYLHAPDGIGRSKLAEKMDRAFKGVTMTARNLNTINKLLDMVGD